MMTNKSSIRESLTLQQGFVVTLSVGLACILGLALLEINGRMIAMIWPAAGVAAGFCYRWGPGAIPWIMLGHVVIWLKLGLGPVTGLTPPLYALEAWLAAYIGRRWNPFQNSGPAVMERTVWRFIVAPLIACFPVGWTIGCVAISHGMFPAEDGWMTVTQIGAAHFHGMIALGPLTIHLLGPRQTRGSYGRNRAGIVVAAISLAITAMAFSGVFRSISGISSAVYLAFPLVVLTGALLPPASVAVFISLWCLLTTLLTGSGTGPFDDNGGRVTPLELTLYNAIFASVAYTVSVGSSRYLQLFRRSRQSLEAGGVTQWEWNAEDGVRWLGGTVQGQTLLKSHDPAESLARLAGTDVSGLKSLPTKWKIRHTSAPPDSGLLVCSGRVLSRGRNGRPLEAIGIIEDLTVIQKAEDALVAVGYQRAKLKSLQSRLNPHFLFNALNATRALIHIDPDMASESVTRLSRLLRGNLKNVDRPLIPLAEEIHAVNDLLAVAAMRFGDRLVSRLDIEPQAASHPVPPMLVFNLVENALIHGIEKCEAGGELHVVARLTEEEKLEVKVRNPGTLKATPAQGIGISDVRQRLELLFGSAAIFSLAQSDERTVTASLLIPYRS